MGRALFLTGRPGIGKTTVIRSVAQVLEAQADGFYTEELRQAGRRVGFGIVGLRGGRATLAHVGLKRSGRPRVGRYGVDVAALERVGVAALRRAIEQGRVVVIDEIGKMELFSPAFKAAVLAALEGPAPLIATVMARPHPWVDPLKARPDVALWQVTGENRDRLPSRVLEWVGASAGTPD